MEPSKFCPRCGELVSYAGNEPYCAYTDCRWNNEDGDCPPPGVNGAAPVVAHPAEPGQGVGTRLRFDNSPSVHTGEKPLDLLRSSYGVYVCRGSGHSRWGWPSRSSSGWL